MQNNKTAVSTPPVAHNAPSSAKPGGGAKSVADRIRDMQLQKASKPATDPVKSRATPPTDANSSEAVESCKPSPPAKIVSASAPAAPPKPSKPSPPVASAQLSPKEVIREEPVPLAPVSRPPPPAPKQALESAIDVPRPPPPPRDSQPPPPPPKERRPSVNNPPPRPPPPPPPRAPPVAPDVENGPPDSTPRAADPRASLLMSIQAGSQKLRTVSVVEKKKEPPSGDAGGILGMLATMISDRRISMQQEDDIDDNSSDSGFSDSGSD